MISVRGLRKRFGPVQAVAGVELQVEAGEVLLLLGQNGAGKSTTLRCLGGIIRPDEGEIGLDGFSLPGDLDAVRRNLGVVPDLARLYGRNTARSTSSTSAACTAFHNRSEPSASRSSSNVSSSRMLPIGCSRRIHAAWRRRWR